MYDAVHLFAKALHDLDTSQQIDIKPLSCDAVDTWPHGYSLINYMKIVSGVAVATGGGGRKRCGVAGGDARFDRCYQVRPSRIQERFRFGHHRVEQGGVEEDRHVEFDGGGEFHEDLRGGVHADRRDHTKQDVRRHDDFSKCENISLVIYVNVFAPDCSK
jgi:hypothetical protein